MFSKEEEIAAFIIEECNKSKECYGSELGDSVRNAFADVDLKTQYGGLHRFIDKFCGGEVVHVAKHGADNVYVHKSKLPGYQAFSQEVTDETVWRAFSNPSLPWLLVLDPTTGELSLGLPEADMPDGSVRIEKISSNEYREMCREFLPLIEDQIAREKFERTLTEEDFWPQWSKLINAHHYDGIYVRWMKWRGQKILEVFEKRLKSSNLDAEIVEKSMKHLQFSRQRNPPSKSAVRADFPPVRDTEYGLRLRNLMHLALDKLGDDELRRIWLPAGVLIDVLKRGRS